jgi:acetyl esterase/lipase
MHRLFNVVFPIVTASLLNLAALSAFADEPQSGDAKSGQKSGEPPRIALWSGHAPVGDGKFEEADAWITVHRPASGSNQKANGAAVVICPGGGYQQLMKGPEGHGIAEWLNRHGITGVVLEYRLPAGRSFVPLLDAQRALRTVRTNASAWGLDPMRVGIMGFSAGGHLASTAGTHFDDGDLAAVDPIEQQSSRPDFVILVYPVITMTELTHGGSRTNLLGKEPPPNLIELFSNEKQVTERTPPTFLAHAVDDKPVPPENSRAFFAALQTKKVPSEYLELPSGGHGLDGYKGPMWDAWQEKSLAWLATKAFAGEPKPPEGFRALFDGRDLNGWYGHNPHETEKLDSGPPHPQPHSRGERGEELTGLGETRLHSARGEAIAAAQKGFLAHWRVDQGELVNDGDGPYATTKEEFADIELLIDYKTVALADSGIYLRGTPQVQIWDYTKEGGKWNIGADKGSGGLFNNTDKTPGRDPLVRADKPFGEWNHFRILQIGARTTVYLNDKLVVHNAVMENFWDPARKRPLPRRGPIHLQTHGGEIRWRNIFVREVPAEEAARRLRDDDRAQGFVSLFNGRDLTGWAGALDDYEVRDGAIVCKEKKGGELFTQEDYDNFVVRLEFKLPPGGNNGLAIRYPGTGQSYLTGMCELQVLDDDAEMYAKLDPRQYHGSAYGMVPAFRGYLRPIGEWNFEEVTVVGPKVKVELNGSVILDADLSQVTEFKDNTPHPGKDRTSGRFGFAGHNDPVMFRNVSIKRLPR